MFWKVLFVIAGLLWLVDLVRIIADSSFEPTRLSIGVAYCISTIYMFMMAARE